MSGEDSRYSVVFVGCDASGDRLDAIKAGLAATFKMKPEQVERLCGSRNVVVRRDLTHEQAQRYQAAFARAGAPCRIVTQTGAAPKPAAPATLTVETLDHFFRGSIPRVPVTPTYRLGLLAVAALMVALPVIFGLILAGVAMGGLWYALHGPALLAGHARGWVWLVAYAGPLVAAVGICVAMLKPLLARDSLQRDPVILTRTDEPLFFAFVDKICGLVGAPRPARIQVNSAVNASAALVPGLRGFFGGGLVLTVGLPLFAGLDTRQLAGVLAHEFGHFAQRSGMRTSALIYRVNRWLYHSVYLPDSWDHWLVGLNERLGNSIASLVWITRGASWVVRRVLWVLMWIGTVVSRFLSRQMEFDADRYEALLAGSACFRQTSFRFRLLSHAFSDVYQTLGRSWEDRRLVDNLPHLTTKRARELEPGLRRQIESEMEGTQTHYFDTHPADTQRVENAERLAAPGVFTHRAPASVLLGQYAALAKRTTWFFYRFELGLDIQPTQLISIDEHLATMAAARQDQAALHGYFHGFHEPYHFLDAPDLEPALGMSAAARHNRLADLVAKVRAVGPDIRRLVPAFSEAKKGAIQAYGESTRAALALDRGSPYAKAATVLQELEDEYRRLEAVFRERLALGLAEVILQAGDGSALGHEARRLADSLQVLTRIRPAYLSAYREAMAVYCLASELEDDHRKGIDPALVSALRKLHNDVGQIESVLSSARYPFAHGRGDTDVLHHLQDELPMAARQFGHPGCLEYVYPLLESLSGFHTRVLGRAASLAATAEARIGLSIKVI